MQRKLCPRSLSLAAGRRPGTTRDPRGPRNDRKLCQPPLPVPVPTRPPPRKALLLPLTPSLRTCHSSLTSPCAPEFRPPPGGSLLRVPVRAHESRSSCACLLPLCPRHRAQASGGPMVGRRIRFPLQERMGPGPAGNAPAGGHFRRVTGRSPSVLEGGADPTWSLSGPQE